MPTRMTHPLHGVIHAVGAEVEWNKQNGWSVDPGRPAAAPVPLPSEPESADNGQESLTAQQIQDELDSARSAWREKWGREPDQRKSAKTLRREAQ